MCDCQDKGVSVVILSKCSNKVKKICVVVDVYFISNLNAVFQKTNYFICILNTSKLTTKLRIPNN